MKNHKDEEYNVEKKPIMRTTYMKEGDEEVEPKEKRMVKIKTKKGRRMRCMQMKKKKEYSTFFKM